MDLEDERIAEAALLQDAKERLAQMEVANREPAAASRPFVLPPTSVRANRMQAASHHAQRNVRRHSFDASARAEGRSQFGSSGGLVYGNVAQMSTLTGAMQI